MAATIAVTKNINQMGIVYMFKESEFFLHNLCGKELQRRVRHSPLNRPAKISNSWCSCDDLVAWYLQNYGFYPIFTTDFNFFWQIRVLLTDYCSGFQIIFSLKFRRLFIDLDPPCSLLIFGIHKKIFFQLNPQSERKYVP